MVLHQNHPNPFNPSTSIAFELPEAAHVTLRVYDIKGSMVRTLVEDRLARNFYSVEWDGYDDHGRGLASGVYYCRLEAGARSTSRGMVMVK
jgi:flagellar hook assembly protein FlgD